MNQFFRPPPVNPTQELCNVTYKHLPNNQTIIIKKEVTKVNLMDGTRTTETHEYPEPYHCANPYGQHKFVLVRDGDNGQVDKEKGIALCFDCLKIRFPHQFRHRLPPPPHADFFKPKEWPDLELPDIELDLDLESFNEELPPLSPLDEEYPETHGHGEPYSFMQNLVLKNPELWKNVNDRTPIVMSEDECRKMLEQTERDIREGRLRIW
jgi:hypothetical protein